MYLSSIRTIFVAGGLVLSCNFAWADSTLILSIAGEAFEGSPSFQILAHGKPIASGTLTKAIDTVEAGRFHASAKPYSYLEHFTFSVPDGNISADDEISVVLTNDKYEDAAAGRDRNLFIEYIAVNGMAVYAADLALLRDGAPQKIDFQAGFLPVYDSGSVAIAKPPVTGWPLEGKAVGLAAMPSLADYQFPHAALVEIAN